MKSALLTSNTGEQCSFLGDGESVGSLILGSLLIGQFACVSPLVPITVGRDGKYQSLPSQREKLSFQTEVWKG